MQANSKVSQNSKPATRMIRRNAKQRQNSRVKITASDWLTMEWPRQITHPKKTMGNKNHARWKTNQIILGHLAMAHCLDKQKNPVLLKDTGLIEMWKHRTLCGA
jgi:hypothetical protein